MRRHIENQHFVTRKRIRFRFRKFIQEFSSCKATVRDLKLKYVVSLETLQTAFYTERFHVHQPSTGHVTIVVSGDRGIRWSRGKEERNGEVLWFYLSLRLWMNEVPLEGFRKQLCIRWCHWRSRWEMSLSVCVSGAAGILWFLWRHWHQYQAGD